MAAVIGNMIQKKYGQSIDNPNSVTQVNSQDKANENNVPFNFYSQSSQFDKAFGMDLFGVEEENADIRMEQEDEITSSTLTKSLSNDLKRRRDDNDLIDLTNAPLKRYHTMENHSNETIEEAYNDYQQNLWSAVDLPENAMKTVSIKSKKTTVVQTTKKLKNYRPEKNSSGCNILIGLLKFENETKKKYASKKEIKQTLKKDKEELGDAPITNWTPISTLIKYDLISNFSFNDEEKYSLTENGFTIATECYAEKIQEKESAAENEAKSAKLDRFDSKEYSLGNTNTKTTSTGSTIDLTNLCGEYKMSDMIDSDFSISAKLPEKSFLKSDVFENKANAGTGRGRGQPIIIDDEDAEETVNFSHYEKLSVEKLTFPKEKEQEKEDKKSFKSMFSQFEPSSERLSFFKEKEKEKESEKSFKRMFSQTEPSTEKMTFLKEKKEKDVEKSFKRMLSQKEKEDKEDDKEEKDLDSKESAEVFAHEIKKSK